MTELKKTTSFIYDTRVTVQTSVNTK